MIAEESTLVLAIAVSFLSFAVAQNSTTYCESSCGGRSLPYPFGFSSACQIRLNCSREEEILVGEFRVQNVSSNSIVISLPPNCSRPIDSIAPLFGNNYALKLQSGLLLHSCNTSLTDCVIPQSLIRTGFGPESCGQPGANLSCFSGDYKEGVELLSYPDVRRTGCKQLFSAIAVDANQNDTVSLAFQTVRLGWWLEGPCRCSRNGVCTRLNLTGAGRSGYRCRCVEGFDGDGFEDGTGCTSGDNEKWNTADCNSTMFHQGPCRSSTKFGVLLGGIVAGASLTVSLAVVFFFIRRRSVLARSRLSAMKFLSAATGDSGIPFFSYREVERATNGFSENQRLGTGAYGTVYAGVLSNGEYVAVKKIKHRDKDSIDQVMNEVKLLSSVSHPNLVRLLGCCIERGEQILVYEFMPNGTLSQHLQRENTEALLPWATRLAIAAETAHAIAHLHSATNPPIYHRDIKSSNILLDYNYKSKVADFGLSRFGMTEMSQSHISTAPLGTPGYVDPQYHQNFHLSDRSDVYSFGVVLLEIITALKVVDFSRPHSEVNLAALAVDRIGRGKVDEIIDPFLDPYKDAWTLSSIHRVAEIAFRCLCFDRDLRPSMKEVAMELEFVKLNSSVRVENICTTSSSFASSCSSPYNGSEKSFGTIVKKSVAGSRRLVAPQREIDDLNPEEDAKECFPDSVHEVWQSDQSSPSAHTLLGNMFK